MAQAGLSFVNPFFPATDLGAATNPYAPAAPTSGIGMGGLSQSLADMAVLGERLVGETQFTMPQMAKPKGLAFNTDTNEIFVQGKTFTADDAASALESEALLSGPNVDIPRGAGWIPLPESSYQQYLQTIKNPTMWQLMSKNFGRGVDSWQMLIGRGAQLAGAEGIGGRIVAQQMEDLRKTSPFERQFTDIESGKDAVDWLAANFAQQGPNLIESIVTAGLGFLGGTAVGGPLAGPGGALAGLLGKSSFKEGVKAALAKKAKGEALDATEQKLLREAAGLAGAVTASYAQNLSTGAADIYGEMREQGVDVDDMNARLRALGGSIPYAALETLSEYVAATIALRGGTRAAMPPGTTLRRRGAELLKRGAIGGGVGGLTEGGTELGQEALVLGFSGQDLTSPESINRFINSFAAGFGIGGPLGAAGNLRSNKPADLLKTGGATEPTPGNELVVPPGAGPTPGAGPALLGGPTTAVTPYFSPVTPAGVVPPVPPQLAGPAAPPQIPGPVSPVSPAGGPVMMVTPEGVAYPDQMLRQQGNVPPGAPGTQGVLDVFGGTISAQELATRMQPPAVAPTEQAVPGVAPTNVAQGALQFAPPAPGAVAPMNNQMANQLQVIQDRLRRQREFDAAQAQLAAQQEMERDRIARQSQGARDLFTMQQQENILAAEMPPGLPMVLAAPVAPVQLPLFTRRQAPRPSRAEALRRGARPPRAVSAEAPTTPLTPAQRRAQLPLITREGKPSVAALKGAGATTKVTPQAPKAPVTKARTQRGLKKAGVAAVEIVPKEAPSAVQVKGAAKVPVQPRAEGGEGVGKEVRGVEKPAGKGEALKEKVRSQALIRKAELEKAGRAWKQYADPKTQPAWEELSDDQKEQWRKVVIEDEKASTAATQAIAPPKPEPTLPKVEAAEAAAPAPSEDVEQTEAEYLAETIEIAQSTDNMATFSDAMKTVAEYAYFTSEGTNTKELVEQARAFIANTQFSSAQSAALREIFLEAANSLPSLEASYKSGARKGELKAWFNYAQSNNLLPLIKARLINVPEAYKTTPTEEAKPAPKTTADTTTVEPKALLSELINDLIYVRSVEKPNAKIKIRGETFPSLTEAAKQLYNKVAEGDRDYLVRGTPLRQYFRADGSPKLVRSKGRFVFTKEEFTAAQQAALEREQREAAKALQAEIQQIGKREGLSHLEDVKRAARDVRETKSEVEDNWDNSDGEFYRDDGTAVAKPVPVGRIRMAVSSFVSKLRVRPSVTVYANVADLKRRNPELYRRAAAARKEGDFDTTAAAGYSFGPNVIIFSDFIRSEKQLRFVLAHETLGHFGFRGVVPKKDLDAVLNNIYDTDGNVQAAVDAMVANRGMSKLEAIEEYLSDNAADLDVSLISRVWNAVKNFLNKLGVTFEDDAARYLINLSRRYVRNGDVGNFTTVRSVSEGMQAMDAERESGRYSRMYAGQIGSAVFNAGALNRQHVPTGGFLGAVEAFAKDVFGSRRDVPGVIARLLESVQTLDNKARRSFGLNQIYRILEKQQQFARSLLSKYQNMTAFTHSPRVFGFGKGVTEPEKERAGELLARAALFRAAQATDDYIKSFKPLVNVDDMGNVVVDEAVRQQIEKAGLVTAEEFRKGFDITYTDGSKVRFQYDVKEDSPEWRVYTELRKTVNESAIDLMLSNYEAAQSEGDRVLGDLSKGRPANKVFSTDDLAALKRVSEMYKAMRYAGSDVANAGVEVKKEAKEKSDAFVIAFGLALFRDDVYAVWVKDPNADPKAVKGLPSQLKDLSEFQKAEYDDIRAALPSLKDKVGVKEQSFAVQKAIRDLFLFDLQAKNADYYAKRTILGSYVPFMRRGTEQVRLVAVDARGNPVALDENTRAALPYFQFENRRDAVDAAEQLEKVFGQDNEFVFLDADGNEVTVRLRAEVSRTRQSPDLSEAVNLNEFVYVLNRMNINLTPDARERIITTLSEQNSRARRSLQRSGTEGWDKNVVRSTSEFLETTAHVAAKKLFRHRLDDILLNNSNWLGDQKLLEGLKAAVDAAPTEGERARAQRAYDEYAYMYRYMRASAGDNKVTIDGKEVPTLGRGEDYREEAKNILRWYSEQTNIADSAEDLLSGETGSRLKLITVLMQLGGSVATAVVNLASIATHSLPYLAYYNSKTAFGGGYGEAKASAALWTASRDVKNASFAEDTFIRELLDKGTFTQYGLTEDEARFLLQQTERGTLQAAQFNALVGTARGKVFSNKAQAAVRAWMSMFSYTEQFNRRVTALAAYRLERARLQAQGVTNADELFNTSSDAARKAVNTAQGEYAMYNRPAMARSNLLQYVFMYKQFVIVTVQLMRSLPPRGQLYMLALLLLTSGVKGLPFADDLMDLLDTLMQMFGFKQASVEKALNEWVDAVAPGMTPTVMRGVLDQFTGATISTRLGMGDLVPLTGAFKAGADPAREIADFAGPVFGGMSGLFGMGADTAKYLAEAVGIRPDVTSISGILRESPIAAARALTDGLLYLDSGMITNSRGQVVSREAPYHVIMARLLGFYPAVATQQNDIVRMSKDVANYAKAIKAEFVSAYKIAALAGDTKRKAEIMRDVAEWNRDARGTGLTITNFARSANRAVLEASRPTALRYLKSAPRQMRPETIELLRIHGLDDEIN